MMMCKRCHVPLKRIMSFENGKSYEFNRCPHCWYETKKLPLIFNQEPRQKNNKYSKLQRKVKANDYQR